ncbi:hypothetical protein GLOTRDRAFT_123747 [Gloeophyllum trabeum ATCC 11539]|uniref:F-box domain-containing protein n=1 Tax=Gloeophyllum trabeum (strain ATCC 11539 / FP-39264 / Madison 617) TaxID=670483 RepID=S7QL45_GLOTA|nr:uncharacterized protein GLOTRDRAFT_123747 [Gloeophyllum trabeum ATCC 11539]EPQ59988.1 hypothetical protein GLOTRDRAFT_123747 [Gloeophyllum trabeum ATCC 11539]
MSALIRRALSTGLSDGIGCLSKIPLPSLSLPLLFASPRRRTGRSLDALPIDILVNEIFEELELRDVLTLRAVNKALYRVTMESVIWKRFLRRYHGPLPPLPPTSRHNFGNMRGIEAERILARAMSFDKNWCGLAPQAWYIEEIRAWFQIYTIAFLPGGHYAVASASNAARNKWYILLYGLDYGWKGCYPLTTVQTPSKAFEITAKYMYINYQHGIVVSYTWRQYRDGLGGDASMLSGKYDMPEDELNYENVTMFTSLATLERLVDVHAKFMPGTPAYHDVVDALPPPFKKLAITRSTSALHSPSLDHLDGQPHVTLIRRPNFILIKNLAVLDAPAYEIECLPDLHNYNYFVQTILAFKHIPFERTLFVVKRLTRRIMNNKVVRKYSFETYRMEYTQSRRALAEWDETKVLDGDVGSVHISELHYPYYDDNSGQLDVKDDKFLVPPTVYVYVKCNNPEEMRVYEVRPELVNPDDDPRFMDPLLSHASNMKDKRLMLYPDHRYVFPAEEVHKFDYGGIFGSPVILPGNGRALVMTVEPGDRSDAPPLKDLWSYIKPDENIDIVENTHFWHRFSPIQAKGDRGEKWVTSLVIPGHHLEWFRKQGVQTIAWDETIGRVAICAKDDPRIFIFDFAETPRTDPMGERV